MKHLHAPQRMFRDLDKNLTTIARLAPDTAVLTEQDAGKHDSKARIERRLGGRYFVCAAPAGLSPHSREIIVLVRKRPGRRIDSVTAQALSPQLNRGMGNDRVMVTVRFSGPRRRYAVIGTHWNAGIQDRKTGRLWANKRARSMDRAGEALQTALRELDAEGRIVMGSADFNYREHLPRADAWEWAPQRIFTRTGTRYESYGLDWVWWNRLVRRVACRVIPAGTGGNHSDHPWLLATLKADRAQLRQMRAAASLAETMRRLNGGAS